MSAPVEVFALVAHDGSLIACETGDSAVAIADSRARWELIWRERDAIAELVHTHPLGPLAFSTEDDSTMTALAAALGRELSFALVAPEGVLRRVQPCDPAAVRAPDVRVVPEPAWADELRRRSNMIQA